MSVVGSGYMYHHRGSEPHWTNSRMCSRDLCAHFNPSLGRGTPKKFAEEIFADMPAPGPHMVHPHTVHLALGALLSPCTMRGTGGGPTR